MVVIILLVNGKEVGRVVMCKLQNLYLDNGFNFVVLCFQKDDVIIFEINMSLDYVFIFSYFLFQLNL